jgi:negative regulator of sigma E activity
MKFLSITDGDETAQWLATSRGARRVSGTNRNDRLFDSDFTLEDLSDYDPEDYELSLLGSERVSGVDCHVLEAVPIQAETDYAKRIMYIDKAAGLLVKALFLDDAGKTLREFELIERMSVEGVPFPREVKMTTVDAGTFTTLRVDSVVSGEDIPDRYFNRGNL